MRVKAPFGSLLLLVMALGCSGRSKAVAPPAPTAPTIQSGAEAWAEGALLLPAGSPAVLSGRLDVVLDAVGRFKAWVIAEPAMLGPEGPRIARMIDAGWAAATGYLGVDPLLPATWRDRGVDPTRKIYVGAYPVMQDGARFVASVDGVLREEIGVAPGKPVAPSLQLLSETGGELPVGTHALILRTVDGARPIGGLRVVIPIVSRDEFMLTASSFAEGMGFRAFPSAIEAEPGRNENFWSPGKIAAMSIRFADGHAVLDLLFPAFGGTAPPGEPGEDLSLIHADLERAKTEIAPGRPRAPAPPENPAVALSFDQRSMSELMRLRGYWRSLEAVQSIASDKRDGELLNAFLSAVAEAEAWSVSEEVLTGTTFQLSIEPAKAPVVGRIGMTMFGHRGLPSLDTTRELPTLDLGRRSVGFSVDLATLRAPRWQAWFVGETADELDALDFESIPAVRALLPGVRGATLAMSNLGHPQSAAVMSEELATMISDLDDVVRFEVVGLAPDLVDLRHTPRFVCAVVMEPGAGPEALERVQAVLAGVLTGWMDSDVAVPALPVLQNGVTTTVAMEEIPIQQRLVTTGEHEVVMFGVGLAADEFASELVTLQHSRRTRGVVAGRLEPIALLSWLRADDDKVFEPLDADILAQRLGAVNLRYEATPIGDANAVTLQLELEAAPAL